MYAYTLYLFFDFAGYSAFAIGFSYLFGVHTPENFRRPFLASNIREFWNRWHVSLSWWLRDHVYMRFVMAATKRSWFPNRHLASHVGLVLALGLMGLWHGTQWQYVLYGLYHGVLLVGHDVFSRRIAPRLPHLPGFLRVPLSVLVTFHAVAFGFLLFSGRFTGSGSPIQ
jgi:membrane protein involved in D-alanine export